MVLHDLHLALRYADHAIALGGERAIAGAAKDVLTASALSDVFGHRPRRGRRRNDAQSAADLVC
jgi:ABC-type cobalamin/Fe3+-siderophores transport system ATPase subunit